MTKTRKCLIQFAGVLLIYPAATIHTVSQSKTASELLEIKIASCEINTQSIIQATCELAVEHRIPIGIINASENNNDKQPRIVIQKFNVSVSEVLNEMIKQDTRYDWEVNDKVINFFPKKSTDEFLNSILNTKYESFQIQKGALGIITRRALIDYPDVKDKISKYKMRPVLVNVDGLCSGNCNYTAKLENVTMKQILNHLARESGIFWWSAVRDGEFFSIVF